MSSEVRSTTIDYTHDDALHSIRGAELTFNALFRAETPRSILDIGCGIGSWLAAARNLGVGDVVGVDGIIVSDELMKVNRNGILRHDLRTPLDLGRAFDLVVCLEVAEHLDETHANTLIDSITRHSEKCLFSAACPGQGGTHHVNCQWPEYWQDQFNKRGFSCRDELRWKIWTEKEIEPWYRQNVFVAVRNPQAAGLEPRLVKVIHPDMLPSFSGIFFDQHRRQIENGCMPLGWYARAPVAAAAKLKRFLRKYWIRK